MEERKTALAILPAPKGGGQEVEEKGIDILPVYLRVTVFNVLMFFAVERLSKYWPTFLNLNDPNVLEEIRSNMDAITCANFWLGVVGIVIVWFITEVFICKLHDKESQTYDSNLYEKYQAEKEELKLIGSTTSILSIAGIIPLVQLKLFTLGIVFFDIAFSFMVYFYLLSYFTNRMETLKEQEQEKKQRELIEFFCKTFKKI